MQWGNTNVYWFFISLVFPLIIHLFFFRRVKEIVFSNVSLLKNILKDNRKSRKLKHLIQLCLRISFFLFLIIVFLDLNFLSKSEVGINKLYFIDNSPSVSILNNQNSNGLINALTYVNHQIDTKFNQFQQYVFDNKSKRIKNIHSLNKDKLLSEIEVVNENVEFDRLISNLKRENSLYEIHYLSDFQHFDPSKLNDIDIPIKLILSNTHSKSNIYIDSVYVEQMFVSKDQENDLIIKLSYSAGIPDFSSFQLKILNEGNMIGTYNLSTNEQDKTIRIPLSLNSLSNNNITIEIDDPYVVYDNQYFISLTDYIKPKIIQIYNGELNSYLQAAFKNEQLFEYQSQNILNLNYDEILQADILILDALGTVPEVISNQFSKSVIVVPGQIEIGDTIYENLFNNSISQLQSDIASIMSNESLNSNLLSGIIENTDKRLNLPEFKIQYNLNGDYEPLLTDQFGRSLLSRIFTDNGNIGRVYFFNVPLQTEFTNFMTHSLFVPVLYSLAFQATSIQPINNFYLNEQFIRLPVKIKSNEASIKVEGSGITFIPNYLIGDDYVQIEIPPDLSKPGFYQLIVDEEHVIDFSLNLDKRESIMRFSSEDELLAIAEANPTIEYIDATSTQKGIAAGFSYNSSLWMYFLVFATIFLIAEVFVARYL